jgi:hypothetical protein
MRTPWSILAVLLGLGLGAVALRAERTATPPKNVAQLIAQLGSTRFAERARATRALDAIGAPALDALRKAIHSPDMETSRRARQLVAAIEKRVEAAAVLAPTRVRLLCKDMPVTDAVAELARKAHCDIQIHPSHRAALTRQKVTLDSGEVSFWEAYDLLCKKAGLVEIGASQNGVRYAIDAGIPAPIQLPRGVLPVQPVMPVNPIQGGGLIPLQVNPAAIQRLQQAVRGVQVLPAQGGFQPAVIRGMRINDVYGPVYQVVNSLLLMSGKPADVPTCYAGAFRLRFLNGPRARRQAGAAWPVQLEVTAEPKLANWALLGSPKFQQLTDDQGQELTPIEPPNRSAGWGRIRAAEYDVNPYGSPQGAKQSILVRFKRGEKQAALLKVCKGSLATQIQTPQETLITVDNILKAAGKTVKGARGGSIKVIEAVKDEIGRYTIRFKLENPSGVDDSGGDIRAARFRNRAMRLRVRGGGRIMVMGGYPSSEGLTLLDGKGRPLQLVGMSASGMNGVFEQSLTFRATQGQGEPVKLVYSGRRLVTVDVPFVFKDVPLPR